MSHTHSPLAVIGGTGMNNWPGLKVLSESITQTPYGSPSGPLIYGELDGKNVVFFARHGVGHTAPPHVINYRANMWALKEVGVKRVIAIAAVGGIAENFPPSAVAVPHDVIDYSYGRQHTYSDSAGVPLKHVEFTHPYFPALRALLVKAASAANVNIVADGVMGVTQGPRLESAAEVSKIKRDGCTMIGMTSMPEAALAAELELEYACLAVSVNWAAGIGSGDIHAEIEQSISDGMSRVQAILLSALPDLV